MNSDNNELKYLRRLIVVLTASGILNIFFISLIFYWLVKDTPPWPYFEQKPALRKEQQRSLATAGGNAELIHHFRSLSFDQLVTHLSNQQLIENGYVQRDIALACLVAFHHFNLTKALLGYPQAEQQRDIIYGRLKSGNPATVTVYPGLSDQQFQAILDFVNTERWPLTSKGLFWQLKKLRHDADPSLVDAFAMTPEFLAVEMLFSRNEVPATKAELQNMLLEGTWLMLTNFLEQQKLAQDLSPARRQRFLLEYLDQLSKSAAYLMIKVDRQFALKKLDDRHVIDLLGLLRNKTSESEKYALDLLISPRSDAVWKAASAKLYQYAGEAMPEKNLHHIALARFFPGQEIIEKPKTVPYSKPSTSTVDQKNEKKKIIATKSNSSSKVTSQPNKDRLYIVQEGDTLWKISRKFNVDMSTLRHHNKLKNDDLKPGTPLRIP